jgi:hypothetical protein
MGTGKEGEKKSRRRKFELVVWSKFLSSIKIVKPFHRHLHSNEIKGGGHQNGDDKERRRRERAGEDEG